MADRFSRMARTRIRRAACLLAAALTGVCLPAQSAMSQNFETLHFMMEQTDHEIVKRPLFSPSRRPPPPPEPEKPQVLAPKVEEVIAAPAAPTSGLEEWILVGVVTSSASQSVLIRDNSNGDVFQIAVGESRNDWELKEVSRRNATFTKGDTETIVGFQSDKIE